MAVLVLADQTGSEISQPTRSAVAAAGQIDSEVHLLVLGAEGAEAAAKVSGVSKVLKATGPAYEHSLAEPAAALLVSLAPTTPTCSPRQRHGQEHPAARRRAARRAGDQRDRRRRGPDTFRRYIYAGNALAT
jgi:electron transfer flavoprotein alpha subunit